VLAGIHVTLTNDRRSPAGIGNEISGSLDPATGVLNIPASSSPEEIRRTGPTPGVWRVSVSPLLRRPTAPGQQRSATPDNLARAYVKSIRFGDEDLPDGTLRLDGPADRQLIIVIGTNPGVVRGRVVDSSDRPMSAMTVVAIPDNGQRFRTDHRFTASDAEGQFLLENMPPGAYKIYAWEQVFPGAWQDSSFIQPYESQGHPISVEEDSTVVVDIRGIPARKR
jgi:hypothetical protein